MTSRGFLLHLLFAFISAIATLFCYATVAMNANFSMSPTDGRAHVARIFVVPTLVAFAATAIFSATAWRRRPRRKAPVKNESSQIDVTRE